MKSAPALQSERKRKGRVMRRGDYLFVLIGEVGAIAVIQLLPMLHLSIFEYAAYSAIYLGFAAFITAKFALLSDVWARQKQQGNGGHALNHTYMSMLTAIALLGGVVVGTLTSAIAQDLLLGGAALCAVSAGVFRAGTAYRLIGDGRALRAGLTEMAGACSAGAAALIFVFNDVYSTFTALICWMLSPLVASLGTSMLPRLHPREVAGWLRENRSEIRALGGESLIKNVESVGTPYLLGGLGGAAALALYRAGSSLTYPVRILIDAVRARIVNGSIKANARTLALLTAAGGVMGACVAGALFAADSWGVGQDAVLGLLTHHIFAVWAWVWVTAISTFIQFAGRGYFDSRSLILRRIAHTLIVMLGTAAALVVFGVGAVIWGAVITRVLAIPLWLVGGNRR